MTTNTISFSVSGFSEIMYGAAILSGIYAGVTIIKEYFAYKKEELYVNAKMQQHVKFDPAGDIKADFNKVDFNKVDFNKVDFTKNNCSFDTRNDNLDYDCSDRPRKRDDNGRINTNLNLPHLIKCNATPIYEKNNTPSKQNDSLAEMIDFDNNTLHVIEEYK